MKENSVSTNHHQDAMLKARTSHVPTELDGERQVTKPTSPIQSCRSRAEFLHSRSRSIAVAPDTMCHTFF